MAGVFPHMVTVAEFTVPPEEFPLDAIFERQPDARVELDRLVPTGHAVVPYFWVHGAGQVELEAEFAADPSVAEIEQIDSVDNEHLFRVEWNPEYDGVLSVFAETQTVLDAAVGTGEQWTFEVRGDDRQDVADLMTTLQENGVPATLASLHDIDPPSFEEFDLTDAQREALTLAHERGYYESPRQTTLEELAKELDISRQALGARLRRGLDHLLESTVS